MGKRDYYQILGIRRNADEAEIRKQEGAIVKPFQVNTAGGDSSGESLYPALRTKSI